MEEIRICDLYGQCSTCPFNWECGIDFDTRRTKEQWIEDLQEEIEKFQIALDKIKAL